MNETNSAMGLRDGSEGASDGRGGIKNFEAAFSYFYSADLILD